jgi:hypothetical protein
MAILTNSGHGNIRLEHFENGNMADVRAIAPSLIALLAQSSSKCYKKKI